MKQWMPPTNDMALSVHFFATKPDLPTLKNTTALRQYYRQQLAPAQGGLIEVEMFDWQGFPAVRTLFKFPQKPKGMSYLGAFTLPFAKYSFVLKIQAAEMGLTGKREAMIMPKMLSKGMIQMEDDSIVGWTADPYDHSIQSGNLMNLAEAAGYDAQFPDHPLSKARNWMSYLAREVKIDPALKKLKPFTK